MNISHDFPATLEGSDKNQWFQILSDFHRKWIIGRRYWLFSYVHSLKANSGKINGPTDLSLSPYQVIPRWLYQYPGFITTIYSKQISIVLWNYLYLYGLWIYIEHLQRMILLYLPFYCALNELPWKQGLWHNYGQFLLVQICTWIIREWLISPYSNGA